jgi:dihydrofolate reductase
MIISLIAAMDRNRVIGVNGRLPWHLPADMGYFVQMTMGKPVIMGRKTYESIPARFRPLRGRSNIILTRDSDYAAPGCHVAHTIEQALAAAADAPEVMVIGGQAVYTKFLPLAHRLYLTLIDAEFPGDAHFPPYDPAAWHTIHQETYQPDENNPYPYQFLILERTQS